MEWAMAELVSRIDDWGRPAWIALTVLAFIVFWPIGLAILAYLLWSGRMSVWFNNRFGEGDMKQQMRSWKSGWRSGGCSRNGSEGRGQRMNFSGSGFAGGSGNRAFDEYRDQTLQRLEDEQKEFHDFLDRLRQAKDRDEFDAFMTDRRNRPTPPPAATGTEPVPSAPRG
jgi:Protein of unknown function (DUF2852)